MLSRFTGRTRHNCLSSGYVEETAKLQLDDPIEGAIYRFCRELVKEYRLSGQVPGSIWID